VTTRHAPLRTACLGAIALLVLVAASGCEPARRQLARTGLVPAASGPTLAEFQNEVAALAQRFEVGVTAAADRIASESDDRELRKRALLWKVRMLPLVHQARSEDDPTRAYADLLTLALAQRRYLVEGEGSELFGAQQPRAVAAARAIADGALEEGRDLLSEADHERLVSQVREVVERYPIRGVFLPETMVRAYAEVASDQRFQWLVNLPLAPIRALEGVDTGARAILEFNATARSFEDLVTRLPQLLRWELELLLYDVEDRETTEVLRSGVASLAGSAESLARTARTLPADLQDEAAPALADLRRTLEQADATLERAGAVTGELRAFGERAEAAGRTWTELVRAVREPAPGEEPGAAEDEEDFDPAEWTRAAARVESAAAELRRLLADARALQEGAAGADGAGVAAAVTPVRRELEAAIDHAAWRGLQLLAVLLVGLFAVRTVAGRLSRRPGV